MERKKKKYNIAKKRKKNKKLTSIEGFLRVGLDWPQLKVLVFISLILFVLFFILFSPFSTMGVLDEFKSRNFSLYAQW